MSHEFLQILWFILIAVLWIGFYFLEGFDFGVGMLMPFLAKKDEEKRSLINAIGATWDGNEVWLLTAGGATFAAFPHWYATMFSGFYLALFLLLIGLILRGISLEYRSKDANPKWRNMFDWMFTIGSFLPALLLGTAFANLAQGVPINEKMMYTGNLFTLLNPYGLLGGITTVLVFMLHGSNFLALKLEGLMRERALDFSKRLWTITVGVFLAFSVYTYIIGYWNKDKIDPGIAPLAALVFLLVAGYFINKKSEGWAFIMVALNIVMSQVSFYLMMFPNVMISSTDPNFNLTIFNTSSTQYTLTVMSIVALIFVPIVLVYQGWTYYMFAKRIKADKKTLVY